MDEIIVFKPLDEAQLREIVGLLLADVAAPAGRVSPAAWR